VTDRHSCQDHVVVEDAAPAPDPLGVIRSRRFLGLLAVAAPVGVLAALIAWGFLELIFHLQEWVFTDLPEALGYGSPPLWWSLPVLVVAGVLTAAAIVRLPGRGGHIPAEGLNPSPIQPIELPGVILAGIASIGLGVVLGPEAPLIAIGGGLGLFVANRLRGDTPPEVGEILAVSATFSALALLFGSPIVAAVLLIEASGIGGPRLPLVLVPGLLASGIGSLVWIGMGSWTGLSTSDISIPALQLPPFETPGFADFGWSILLAAGIAVGVFAIFRLARETQRFAAARPFLLLPACGLAVAGLAIAFAEATDKGVEEVLFSGQEALGSLVANPGSWSLSALALLVAFKGVAYGLSLGSFRGGPVFPSMFLGAAAGLMAAQLPGFDVTPAVAVGIGAGVAAVLGLPLSGALLGILLTSSAGPGSAPLVIVGVIVAYMIKLALEARWRPATPEVPQSAASAAGG
jgi:chloride channel protein, CIC family